MIDFFTSKAELILLGCLAYLGWSLRRVYIPRWKRQYYAYFRTFGPDILEEDPTTGEYEKGGGQAACGLMLIRLFWMLSQGLLAAAYLTYGFDVTPGTSDNKARSLAIRWLHLVVLILLRAYSVAESRIREPRYWAVVPLVISVVIIAVQSTLVTLVWIEHIAIASAVLNTVFLAAILWGAFNQLKLYLYVRLGPYEETQGRSTPLVETQITSRARPGRGERRPKKAFYVMPSPPGKTFSGASYESDIDYFSV